MTSKTQNSKPPQKGRVTYHHDQLITPDNFSTRKTIPTTEKRPRPEFEEFDCDIFVYFMIKKLLLAFNA